MVLKFENGSQEIQEVHSCSKVSITSRSSGNPMIDSTVCTPSMLQDQALWTSKPYLLYFWVVEHYESMILL